MVALICQRHTCVVARHALAYAAKRNLRRTSPPIAVFEIRIFGNGQQLYNVVDQPKTACNNASSV